MSVSTGLPLLPGRQTGRRGVVVFLLLLLFLPLIGVQSLAAAPGAVLKDDDLRKQKAGWLIDKGLKARAAGKIDEAAEAFEDAYEMYPANVRSLLVWGETLCQAGMHERAFQILAKVPINSLPPGGQVQVHLLNSRIHFVSGENEKALKSLEAGLAAQPQNDTVKARLALLLQIEGDSERSAEILDGMKESAGLSLRERFGIMLLECSLLRLGKAFQSCDEVASGLQRVVFPEDTEPLMAGIWQVSPLLLLAHLPNGLGLLFNAVWWLVFLGAIVFLARVLHAPGTATHDLVFVLAALGHVLVIRWFADGAVTEAALGTSFFDGDAVWVFPRQLSGMQMLSAALFPVFSIFRFLPKAFQPQRRELFAIWFFTFWFMLGVLLFQCNMELPRRLPGLALCFAATLIAAVNLPLCRYLLFQAGRLFGINVPLETESAAGTGGAGFTELKIREAKALSSLEREEFQQVVASARAIFGTQAKKAFPGLWQGLLHAQIELEDYFVAETGIREYLESFAPSTTRDSGLLISAYFKSLAGDHPGAFSIIDGIPVERARAFSSDQTALSLLVLGRFHMFNKNHVQAHMDLSKGAASASNPLLHARLLLQLCQLDSQMERPDGVAKSLAQGRTKPGGTKTRALIMVMESVLAETRKEKDKALELAKKACEAFPHNGQGLFWLGKLFISRGQFKDAETLLEKMVAGSEEADWMMQAITTRTSA